MESFPSVVVEKAEEKAEYPSTVACMDDTCDNLVSAIENFNGSIYCYIHECNTKEPFKCRNRVQEYDDKYYVYSLCKDCEDIANLGSVCNW